MIETIYKAYFEPGEMEKGRDGRVPPGALCRFFQTAAAAHAERLGVGMGLLRENGVAWMIANLRVCLSSHPENPSRVAIETWPFPPERRHTVREFRFFADGAAEPFCIGSSKWFLVDSSRGRPVVFPPFARDFVTPSREALFLDPFRAIPKLGSGDARCIEFPVRLSDLDVNNHVNHTHYVAWIEETVPEEVRGAGRSVDFDIAFRSGAVYGETVVSRVRREPDSACGAVFLHLLTEKKTGREIVRARTRWD